MGLHQGEQGPHHLSQHGGEVGGRVLRIMNLGSEKTLTHLGSARNGFGRHPNVDSETRHIGLPDVLLEIVLAKLSGESRYLPPIRPTEPPARRGLGSEDRRCCW